MRCCLMPGHAMPAATMWARGWYSRIFWQLGSGWIGWYLATPIATTLAARARCWRHLCCLRPLCWRLSPAHSCHFNRVQKVAPMPRRSHKYLHKHKHLHKHLHKHKHKHKHLHLHKHLHKTGRLVRPACIGFGTVCCSTSCSHNRAC